MKQLYFFTIVSSPPSLPPTLPSSLLSSSPPTPLPPSLPLHPPPTHSYRAVGMVDAPPAKTFEYVIPGPRRLKWDKTIKVCFHTNMCCFFTDHICNVKKVEPMWNNVHWQSFWAVFKYSICR